MVDPAQSSSGSLRRTQDVIWGTRSSAVSAQGHCEMRNSGPLPATSEAERLAAAHGSGRAIATAGRLPALPAQPVLKTSGFRRSPTPLPFDLMAFVWQHAGRHRELHRAGNKKRRAHHLCYTLFSSLNAAANRRGRSLAKVHRNADRKIDQL